MTFDFDAAEKEYASTKTETEWMEAGDHVCTIVDAYTQDKDGIPHLYLWLEEVGTGLRGRIMQSFEPSRIKWLKLATEPLGLWSSLKDIDQNAGAAMGVVVEVESKQNGDYTNHYIRRVIEKPEAPERQPGEDDDDMPNW